MPTLTCPSCSESFILSDVSSGESLRCPKCRKSFTYTDGGMKQKVILAGVVTVLLLGFIAVVWFSGGVTQRDAQQKTQQMIDDKGRQAEEFLKSQKK